MKIALLCFDNVRAKFLEGLEKGFRFRGHKTHLYYQSGYVKEPGRYQLDWLSFQTKHLDSFNPDRLIIFNGYASESVAATTYLRSKYKTYFVERAWLPQGCNVYVDSVGLGGRSSLASQDLGVTQEQDLVEATKTHLKTIYKPESNPNIGDYVLVPLQLEKDTSILYDSPNFKTMLSLIEFVKMFFKDHQIVVKPHPYNKDVHYNGVKIVKDISMNTLAFYSRAVVGINSTSLIESLVHEKPVLSLGRGVLSSSGVFLSGTEALKNPRLLLSYTPKKDRLWASLHNLHSKQFLRTEAPESVLSRVENGM